jgi:hypothetical protein
MNDKLLREEYRYSLYDRLSLKQLYACHKYGNILSSLVLWHRGLINITAIRRIHPGMNRLIIQNAYRLIKERGY